MAFQLVTFLESFRTDHKRVQLEMHKRLVTNLRGLLAFHHQGQYLSWNQVVSGGITPGQFGAAVSLVTAALNRGYHSPNPMIETLLSTPDWAALACTVVAAAGRGYARSHDENREDYMHSA